MKSRFHRSTDKPCMFPGCIFFSPKGGKYCNTHKSFYTEIEREKLRNGEELR